MTTDRALNAGVAESSTVDEADEAPGRVSRIVEIVEREASPVIGAEEPKKDRDQEFEIETDLDESQAKAAAAKAPAASVPAEASSADEIIEVSDAEIEALPARSTQPSPRPIAAPPLQRSRPPERPSMRPRGSVVPSAPGSLPPPRASSPGFPSPFAGSSPASPSGPPAGSVDPWLLANRTLELSRAQARIAELEEFIAFRDARIVALEERLAETEARLRELEQKGPRSEGARSSPVAAAPAALQQPKAVSAGSARPGAARTADAAPKPQASVEVPKPAVKEPAPKPQAPASEVTVVRPVAAPSTAPAATVRSAAPVAAPAPSVASAPSAPEEPKVLAGRESPAPPASAEELDETTDGGEAESLPEPSLEPRRAGSSGDDLRSIAGIGPRFEAALRKQGITRLSQIAAWSEDDVRQVAKALKIPKSRIVKGRWVESAREAIGTGAASE